MDDELQSSLLKLASAYGAGDEHGMFEHTGSVIKAAIDAKVTGVAQAMLDGMKNRGVRIKAVLKNTEHDL